jgi:ubiquinone/menaquinone biosynthesis C-methylase UbiE
MEIQREYILQGSNESERLERQSRTAAFDYRAELCHLAIQDGHKVLDAGCGSGIVSNYLSQLAGGVEVFACDYLQERVDAARLRYASSTNIHFFRRNLLDLDPQKDAELFQTGLFDTIVCRFVLRHLAHADGMKALHNFYRALKPGGTLYCIDAEGLLSEIYSASPFLSESLRKWRYADTLNLQIARKLPGMVHESKFENVTWHLTTVEFKGDALAVEIENIRESLQGARLFGETLLGGAEQHERFMNEYIDALKSPGGVLFYNKIAAIGKKPK